MRVTNISFSNTIPEVKVDDHGVTVDFGLVTLEMNSQEWESLKTHVSIAFQDHVLKTMAAQVNGGRFK